MHFLAELIGYFLLEVLGVAAFHTARIVLLILSFGLVRVQGAPGSPYLGEPEFGWHNVIWKWDGRQIWISWIVGYFLGLFVWGVVLAALLYCWRSLG